MKVTDKLVDSVVEEIVGDNGLHLVHTLKGRENVSEFKLASELRKEVNEVRNLLYRLNSLNLVSFTRKKDREKGWYIYYWTFEKSRVPDAFRKLKMTRLESLKNRLDREKASNFYLCPNNCLRLDFDQATEFSYHCPECGLVLNQDDNQERMISIKGEISQIESSLKESMIYSRATEARSLAKAAKIESKVKAAPSRKIKIKTAKITMKKATAAKAKSKIVLTKTTSRTSSSGKHRLTQFTLKKRIPVKATVR